MATIRNTINLQDRMTPVLRSIIKALQSTVQALAGVDQVSDRTFNRMRDDVAAAQAAVNAFNTNRVNDQLQQANNNTQNLQRPIQSVTQGFSNWQAAIITANQALSLVQRVVGAISDKLTQAAVLTDQQSRLKLIADEQNDIYTLQKMITQSAMNTRSTYESTADSAMAMYSALSGAGYNQTQSIRLAEILNKQLGAAGVKGAAAASVMYNLNQSLAAGKLRWEDWRIISSNAGGMVANMAKAAGVTTAEFNNMVQKGKVSATDFARYLAMTGEEIDKVYDEMPDTFVDWMTHLQTFFKGEFLKENGLNEKLNEIFGSDAFKSGLVGAKAAMTNFLSWLTAQANKVISAMQSEGAQRIMNTLSILGGMIAWVVDQAISFGTAVVENWAIIEPIVLGLVAAWALYNSILTAVAIKQGITNALGIIKEVQAYREATAMIALAGAMGSYAAATDLATVAQAGFNTVLLANPITWVILAVLALIATFYAVIAVINKVAGTTYSATGMIVGAIYAAGATIANFVIGVLNALIQAVWTIFAQPFVNVIEWVINAANGGFNSFGGAVANLIGQITGWFLQLGKVVTKIIDAIFGTNWTAGLESLRSTVTAWGKSDKAISLTKKEVPAIQRVNTGARYNKGYGVGEKFATGMSGIFSAGAAGAGPEKDYAQTLKDSLNNASNIAANTAGIDDKLNGKNGGAKVKGEVSITEEDIKMLKDIAAIEWVNKFTTLTPTMNIQFGDVHETADTNGILKAVETMIVDAYSSSLVEG